MPRDKTNCLAFPAAHDTVGGMTMRQYYKAAALTGLLAGPGQPHTTDKRFAILCSAAAADIADAMLAEDRAHEQEQP